jgi:signal transduction histidine kinase
MIARFGGTLVLAFVASLVLLIAIGFASYRSVRTLIANNELVDHTQEVLDQLQEIRIQIIQVEADARGYLLTGDRVYLEAYDRDRNEIPAKIAAVKANTQDNISHQEKFPTLEEAVRLRLELLHEYVGRREVLGVNVIPSGQTSEGKRRMDVVWESLDEIAGNERALLNQRLEQSRESSRQLVFTLRLSFVGAFGLIGLVFYFALRDIRSRELTRLQAEAANDAKDEFMATLSHELRTPLNVMLGWVHLLRKNGDNEEIYAHAVDAIERSARTQTQLVDDLLDIARIKNDSLTLKMKRLDVATIIEPAAMGLRPVAEDRDISLEITVPDSPCIVQGDADRLQQVVNNLLSNAIKFTPLRGSVKVSLERIDSRCIITVTDTGKGIDPEFLPFLFDRYSQSKDATSGRKGGLGLGLAIARRIVEMHKGSIRAESEGEGKGSTFIVELPLDRSPVG